MPCWQKPRKGTIPAPRSLTSAKSSMSAVFDMAHLRISGCSASESPSIFAGRIGRPKPADSNRIRQNVTAHGSLSNLPYSTALDPLTRCHLAFNRVVTGEIAGTDRSVAKPETPRTEPESTLQQAFECLLPDPETLCGSHGFPPYCREAHERLTQDRAKANPVSVESGSGNPYGRSVAIFLPSDRWA